MNQNPDITVVEMSAICYSLQQAYSSRICIVFDDCEESDLEHFRQLKLLVEAIDTVAEVIPVSVDSCNWYNADLIATIKAATSIEDIYPKQKLGKREILYDCYADPVTGNRPCDNGAVCDRCMHDGIEE